MTVILTEATYLRFAIADTAAFNASLYEAAVRAAVCAGTHQCIVTAVLASRRRQLADAAEGEREGGVGAGASGRRELSAGGVEASVGRE